MITHPVLLIAHPVLYSRKFNENASTKMDPIAPFDAALHTNLLSAASTHCVSSDNDMLISCKTYEVRDVELPDWLSPQEWVGNSIRWAYVFAYADKAWPEAWVRAIGRIEGAAERYACAKLLGTRTFRSAFRASLRGQLEKWIAGNGEYATPFSYKQWSALLDRYTRLDAERIEAATYRRAA